MFGPVLVTYVILSFHHAHGLQYGLGGARSEPRDGNLPDDMARQEANRAPNKKIRAQKERE
jgi:hypothetical protein